MNNVITISIVLMSAIPYTQTIAGPKKMMVHHKPEQHVNIHTLPLNTKLSLILQYARELESRLPDTQYPDQLSRRQIASNIRIFAQSALNGTAPCAECIAKRQQERNSQG